MQQKSAGQTYMGSGTEKKNPSPLNRVTGGGEEFNVRETICSFGSDPFKIRWFQGKLTG